MQPCKTYKGLNIQALAVISLFLQACGVGLTPATGTVQCSTGQAILQIYDGRITRLCGCNESSGASFTQANNGTANAFICTAKASTRITLIYVGITAAHTTYAFGTNLAPVAASAGLSASETAIPYAGSFAFSDTATTGYLAGTIVGI